MSIFGVIAALERNSIVNLGGTWIGEVCGAVSFIYLDAEGNSTGYRTIEMPINEFSALCDNWRRGEERAKPNIPEIFSLVEDCLYDFSGIPKMDCPVCLCPVSFRDAIRFGRFAYCKCCNARVFKASKLDGTRDNAESYENKSGSSREREARKEKEKPPTADQMTIEELVTAGMVKPMKRKMTFST